jgi:Holliday junction resolvase RusA-like endonuclease
MTASRPAQFGAAPDTGASAAELSALPGESGGPLEGPWEQAFWFCVPGEVRSKSNHRQGDRRGGKTTWSLVASYELAVMSVGRKYRPAHWEQGEKGTPVASRPKIVAFCFARTMLDVGNIDKSLLDALQGVVMATDAQVCWSTSAGVRDSSDAGVLVAIARLDRTATLAAQLEASCALAQVAMAQLLPTGT